MQPLASASIEERRPILLLPTMIPFLLSLSFLQTPDGIRAFSIRDIPNVAEPATRRGAKPRPHWNQRPHHGRLPVQRETALASTPLREEDVIATSDDFGTPFPEGPFSDEDPSPSPSGIANGAPMRLTHEGNRLELSLAPDVEQPPIVIFDGLSPERWTAVDAPKASASASPSFRSLVLRTGVPSVPIESLPLGNFLASPDATDNSQRHPHKFLAAARLNRYWMGPKFGSGAAEGNADQDGEIPVDTQYLLAEVERGGESPYYALLMPLVDGGFRSSLEPSSSSIGDEFKSVNDGDPRMTLVSYSESGEVPRAPDRELRNAIYIGVHDDPYELLHLAFREVSIVLGGSFRTLDEKQIPSEFVNSFGWCSWDAFYSKVNPTGVLEGVRCLSDAGIPVKNVILDDGWQQVSPPYLHQQEEVDSKKATYDDMNLAASLSLSGSSDTMPAPNSTEVSSASSSGSSADSVAVSTPDRGTAETSAPEFLSRIGESLYAAVASTFAKIYQTYVEKAPVGSLPHALWTFAARYTPLNDRLWEFFDAQTDFGRQLDGFDPNWKFLPDGAEGSSSENKNMALKELVGSLKNDWNVNKVYCWHSIHGYWRGASDNLGESIGIDVTQVVTRATDHILRIEPEMAYDPPSLFGVGLIGKKDDLSKFYKNLHEPLAAAGVDGVKVDVQSGVTAAGFRGNPFEGCPPVAKLYTQTMEESVASRFPSAKSDPSSVDAGAAECINCMCHSTENLYRYRTTAVARASDDFYPARPESHAVHLVNVAYNSLFLGEICLPDWDMFHSEHASAELHAAARAIGGCPVYVSDAPGKHNIPLLKKLVLPDGSVLRAKKAGRPTRDCLFADVGRDGTSALKIWNVNRESSTSPGASGGVLGAFNVQGVAWSFETNENRVLDPSPSSVTASVRPRDVESLREIDGSFAVWSHRTGSLTVLPDGSEAIETTLEPRDWEIFTIQPVQRTEGDISSSVSWAPIGLGNMLNSGGAIIDAGRLGEVADDETNSSVQGSGGVSKRIQVDNIVRGPGSFVSYCQPRPSNVLIRNRPSPKRLDFRHDPQSGLLEFDLPQETTEGEAHLVTVIWEQ